MSVSVSTWDVTEPVEMYVTVSFSGDNWEDTMNRVLTTEHPLELEVTRCDTDSSYEFEWVLHVGGTSVPVIVNMEADNLEAYKRFTTYTNHDIFFLDVESIIRGRTRRNSTNGSVTFLVSVL